MKIIKKGNRIEYYNYDGELHRLDGPAVIYDHGTKYWFKNGKLHRENNLPAIEYDNGDKEYYVNGNLHREDGYAIDHIDGTKEYSLNGKFFIDKQEYEKELIKIKLERLKNNYGN